MSDQIVRALTRDGSLRVCAADTTNLCRELQRRQQTDPTATVALGRLATGAALMSSLLKGTQRVGLIIEGNGPLKRLHAEANAKGQVRASVKNPVAGLPPLDDRFDVAGAIGKAGFLHVIKDLHLKEPYRGMVQLSTSEVGDDLAYYFATSEQTPSTVAVGVELDQQARVAAAGGFLLQLMPDADPKMVDRLEQHLKNFAPTTTLLRQGCSCTELLDRVLKNHPYRVLGHIPLTFSCSCDKQQTSQILSLLGREELQRLLLEPGPVTVTCEYCKESYDFDRAELEKILAALD